MKPASTPWPDPTDEEAWRTVVDEGRLHLCPHGLAVAALRALQTVGRARLVDALADHVSDAITRRLRGIVSTAYPNRGEDIMEAAHAKLLEGMLDPTSADGPNLVHHFGARVAFRAIDAIRAARLRHHRESTYGLDASANVSKGLDPGFEDGRGLVSVEALLLRVEDPRKRLAFRLFMEGARIRQGDNSVATVLGIDPKTAKKWIEEAKSIIAANMDIGG